MWVRTVLVRRVGHHRECRNWAPSAVHPVLSAFLICVFSESALTKFSRKPSTKHSLGIKGRHLFPASDLDKSEAWKQGNPDVSVTKCRGGLHISRDLYPPWQSSASLTASDHLKSFFALKGLVQWISASVYCVFLPLPGPQHFWCKVFSEKKVGFLPDF